MANTGKNNSKSSASIRTDGSLLEEFVSDGSHACFAEIVGRHTVMVRDVCLRRLNCSSDFEDASQAVFLILLTKAPSLLHHNSVGGWLHNVAKNVCQNANRVQAKRRSHEREAAEMNQRETDMDHHGQQIKHVLDDELDRMPEKYRLPVLLFHLEGHSQEEVAELLGIQRATVAKQLARAREMLRSRLARRGIATSVAALVASLTPGTSSAGEAAELVTSTVQAARMLAEGKSSASGALSAKAAALAKGTSQMLMIAKMQTVTLTLVAIGLLVAGGVVAVQRIAKADETPAIVDPTQGLPSDIAAVVTENESTAATPADDTEAPADAQPPMAESDTATVQAPIAVEPAPSNPYADANAAIMKELADGALEPSDIPCLERLANSNEQARLAFVDQLLDSVEQTKRLQRKLPSIVHAVVGLAPKMRQAVRVLLLETRR